MKGSTLLFITAIFFANIWQSTAQTKFILDADTGNEMDDFYAIVRALIDPEMEIIGLTSAHYNNTQLFVERIWNENPVLNYNTVEVSQQYNEQLLDGLQLINIPHPIGCKQMLGYAWGYYAGAQIPSSPAVDFIIAEAKKASPENKLGVICIGASTNLATALETAPEIAKNISAFLLGAQFNVETGAWNKSEFNIRNDLNAFDVLLNNDEIALTVMPIDAARPFVFRKSLTQSRLATYGHPVTDLLKETWDMINAKEERVMWDLALIIAMQKPHLAKLENKLPPPENSRQSVDVYTWIDVPAMEDDFWSYLDKTFKN